MDKKRIELKEYLEHTFPCTCAGFYTDARKKDPQCFICNNIDRLLMATTRIRNASYQEGKWHGKKKEDLTFHPSSFWLVCKKPI